MRKTNKGITLVALIITIIIMLILVGVSVKLATDGKLIGTAKNAVDNWNDKVALEQNIVDALTGELDSVIQSQCSHEWGEWTVTKQASCSEEGSKTRTCTKCGKTETAKIATLPHMIENSVCTECGHELVIGAPIDYKEYIDPSTGVAFTTMPSYESTAEKNGSTDTTYTVANNSGIEWIVLGEENGQIKITTKNVVKPVEGGYTSGGYTHIRFSGQAGYSNFIEELHEIGAIYGKGKYADTGKFIVTTGGVTGGRSFQMEDLNFRKNDKTAAYTYSMHDDGKVYRYEVGVEVDGTSTSGGRYSKFEYMKLAASEATEETEELKEWSELKTEANGGPTSVTIYLDDYSVYGSLLANSISKADTSYWLASRRVVTGVDYLYFLGIHVTSNGHTNNMDYYIYSSTGHTHNSGNGVRPVVYLESDTQFSYDSETGYTIIP